jgi:hypothetical protein
MVVYTGNLLIRRGEAPTSSGGREKKRRRDKRG